MEMVLSCDRVRFQLNLNQWRSVRGGRGARPPFGTRVHRAPQGPLVFFVTLRH